jgi:PAS domain S-box-containing protein
MNDFTTELTGYGRDELIGKNLLVFIAPDDHERALHNMVMMLEGRQTANEYTVLKKDGASLYFEMGGDVLRDEDGKPFGRVYVCRDITPRRLAEKERAKLQEQLVQSQKMESVGRLAGGVAHDFNNMLSIIIGNAEMALQDLDRSNPMCTVMKDILNAGERSADLTRQLLAFARKQTIAPRILDLNQIVTNMLKMLQRLIGEDIHLVWMPGQLLWAVNADPSQVDQILANLVVNARDAIEDAGKITIETANVVYDEVYCKGRADCLPGEYVLLAVSDNGMGIGKEILSSIFEPFFTTKKSGEGTGLGLATVYGIVRQNGGFINVYSEPGKGTTFRIYLPRCLDDSALNEQGKDETRIKGGTETVLVVEDEAAVLNLTRDMIEKLGYCVLAARRADEAMALALDHDGRIDLLLTDVVMPEMNGKELARKITSIRPDLKCLYMSGYTANVIAHHGILDKGVRFIAKPFSVRDLAARLREALDGE